MKDLLLFDPDRNTLLGFITVMLSLLLILLLINIFG